MRPVRTPHLPHPIRLVALAAACVLLAAACGGSKSSNGETAKPAKQILKDAQRAASSAHSVHANGHGVESGQKLTLDISISKGSGAHGTFTLFGGSVEMLLLGDKLYLRGDRAFWQHFGGPGVRVSAVANRWVVAPSSNSNFSGFTGLMTMAGFTSRFGVPGKVTHHGETTFNGQKVIALRDAAENGTFYVSATGTPYPVAIVGGKSAVTLTFDHWNQPISLPKPPPHALAVLGG